ncbi:MFS general substrate transporter [Clavulina sp. PMI_390]|nr:MFS general substrate transporter [Clavulina sp. PMI_390]
MVTWDSPEDPANPRNWPIGRKWRQVVMVSMFTLMSPIVSSMLTPALPAISSTLHMAPGFQSNLSFSIFVLAYAVGPFFLAPLSEILGRQIILQCANMFFLIFNIACSQARTSTQLVVFRFLTGLGGSAPLAVGGGTIGDLFTPDQRGMAMGMYTLAPLVGPALGPIAGGFIAENTSWRWVFYSSSIADGVVQLFGFFLLKETYAPKILADKAKRLRKETGNDKLRTQWERPDRTMLSVVAHGLVRALKLFVTEPIIQVVACYMAVIYGLMYLLLAAFAPLWTKEYGESVGISGLNYLSLAIGLTIGGQVGSRILDRTYASQKQRTGGVGTPEMRMPFVMATSFFIPVGLLIYGWSAEHHVFWLVPNIGVGIFCVGGIAAMLALQTYIVDNYGLLAASALAGASGFRSLAGFGFPLFASAMFDKLGNGWGCSVLALVALVFIPAPFLFYRFGPWLRKRSRNASVPPSPIPQAPGAKN